MCHWFALAAVPCVSSMPVLAQEKPPVVLVWGEYLAAVNAREAPGTRSYMENIASALDAVGLAYAETKDSEAETGALEGHKFAIFPYNSNLTDAEREAIRAFVAGGGRIWASFTGDPALDELLGVEPGGSQPAEYEGYYSFMQFTAAAPPGAPEAVANGSWYSHSVTLAPGTEVIATWADADREDTGLPAITMNENGYYHCHVMLGGDRDAKGRMFLALIGHFFPEVWRGAVERAMGSMAEIHGYDSWDAVAEAAKRAEGRGGALARTRLMEATKAEAAARESFDREQYAEALTEAAEAKRLLRSATYPLARTREGELRAVWMSGGSVEDWEAVMEDLAGAGFNAIFPHLCDAGGAHYESDVLPKAAGYERDQLAACIEAARQHDIEVHPWRVNWRISSGTEERRAELRAAGRLSKAKDGSEGDWLCPSDERNFQLEVDAMVEMAERYPVEGIHFDYIRYDNANFCYCEKCHRNFERDADVKVESWPADVLAGGKQYEAFQDWRREQITRVVREVYRRAHESRPDIVVSAAVFLNWPSSRISIGQDAAAWAEEGIIDLLMPMTYTNSNDVLAARTREHVELTEGRAIVAEGIGAFSSHSQFTGPDQLIQQIETARGLGADGFCIFHYGTSLQQGFLPALAEGCTGPRTFTPMLRPPATFELDGETGDEWVCRADGELAARATVEGAGPWAETLTALEATLFLQGLDGRDIRRLGKKQRIPAGGSHTWDADLKLSAGAYRLAVQGAARLGDNSTRAYICRSRPLQVLAGDEYDLRLGKLPEPSKAAGKPRVGVLTEGFGGKGILGALQGVPEIEAAGIPAITADAARQFQVLVVTQGRSTVSVDEHMAKALRGWIEAGAAVLVTHDAVGYRGHEPICPAVCRGGVTNERGTTVVATESPVVPAEYRGGVFEHAFYDHVILEPGDAGEVVVTDQAGKPVVVVGKVGHGRFAACGIAIGLNADTQEEAPTGDEADLLQELVLWLTAGS